MRIPAGSVEYVRVPIASLDASGALRDPTADTAEIAFTADESVAPSSWTAATWETSEPVRVSVGTRNLDSTYKAVVLVGPGTSNVLTAGRYAVWVKVTGTPEAPIRFAGYLTVY